MGTKNQGPNWSEWHMGTRLDLKIGSRQNYVSDHTSFTSCSSTIYFLMRKVLWRLSSSLSSEGQRDVRKDFVSYETDPEGPGREVDCVGYTYVLNKGLSFCRSEQGPGPRFLYLSSQLDRNLTVLIMRPIYITNKSVTIIRIKVN